MKNVFLALFLLTVTISLKAQIVLTSADMPVPPTVLYYGADTIPSGISIGQAGANRTWTFTNVTRRMTDTIQHKLPSSTSYAGTYPTATDAVTINGSTYAFFKNSATAYTCLGLAGDLLNNGSNIDVTFNPTLDGYRFPTNYGNNFNGNYAFTKTASGSSVGQPLVYQVRLTFTATYWDTIDGWGTTITPVGSYNSLREKHKEYNHTLVEAKLTIFSNWSTVSDTRDTVINHTWLAKESKGPLVTLGLDSVGNIKKVSWSLIPPATPPVAGFTAANPYGGFVQFTNTSTGNPTTYAWTFGDGGTSTGTNPSHTYAANGTYNVCLIASNTSGIDTFCTNVTVTGIYNTVINGPTTMCSDSRTGVAYSSTLRAGNSYAWNATGGTITTGSGTPNITVNWNPTGPYSLRLIECNSTGQFCDTATLAITILPVQTTTLNQTVCYGQSALGHSTSGTYIDTFTAANGCDSIRTLNLTVRPQNTTTITQNICTGESYGGHSTSGTFIDTFASANNCDSIRTLNLTVRPVNATTSNVNICPGSSYEGYNATGTYVDTFSNQYGCDSVRTLNLNVLNSITDTLDLSICNGSSYYGYSSNGTYIDTFSSGGCDSVRVLNLTVVSALYDSITSTICSGDTLYGYTQAGTFVDTFTASTGCDSTRTLFLTVLPSPTTTFTRTICFGDTSDGHTTSGVFTDVFTAANGCDSTRILNLTVRPQNTTSVTRSVCNGDSFEGYSSSGVYTDIFTGSNGCDSIRTLFLTVKVPNVSNVTQTICAGENVSGHTSNGAYVDTLTDATGCDSIRNLQLTVLQPVTSTNSQTICAGESYLGHTAGGNYTDTLVSSAGCDSIQTLTLTVLPAIALTNASTSICDGDSVLLGGIMQTAAGTYYDTLVAANGCDSVLATVLSIDPAPVSTINWIDMNLYVDSAAGVTGIQWYLDGDSIAGATSSSYSIIANGDYTVAVTGSNGCSAVSEPVHVTGVGIEQLETGFTVECYPNPTTGTLYLEVKGITKGTYSLYNSLGQLMNSGTVDEGQSIVLDLKGKAEGIYFVKVRAADAMLVRKVLLQK
jgi:PKD repeat protein